MSDDHDDPYLWLEDVEGTSAMEWVSEQNASTDVELTTGSGGSGFEDLQRGILEVLDSVAKIPFVRMVGDRLYNFWQDAEHERGLWRRTTLDEYRKPEPAWETVLDLDALSEADGASWVWHGADFLKPDNRLALVALSRGGSDADITREFDVEAKAFVEGGFERPEAKGSLGWIDADRVFVSTDFGAGSMTASGYPRILRQWTRGTGLADAATVFEGTSEDIGVFGGHDDTPGYERDLVERALTFFSDELYLRDGDRVTKIDVPDSATKSVHRDWLLVRLREDWDLGSATYAAGSLLAARFEEWLGGDRNLAVLFEPDEHSSLQSWTWTRSHLVLNVLEDVKSRLRLLTPGEDGWTRGELRGVPELGTVQVSGVDADVCDEVWLTTTDFLAPTSLSIATVGEQPEALKSQPEFFDTGRLVVEQRFATSGDGTRVPYFLVHPRGLALDGTAPTLLYGYGGFESPMLPAYNAVVGRSWLANGGVYALANIRGGGEYGPAWHRSALREHRHRAYEDFAAVARDIADSGVSTSERIGAVGGSNGGLLVGNMLTRYPRLFGALVIQVPLLDMRRYSRLLAGASWVAEYGDPDVPGDWEFLRAYSPYQSFDADAYCPPTFIWTTTRDDRVHPGHARKMASLMLAAGKDVRYFENTEGGHGAGSTNKQAAHVMALQYAFLRRTLG